MTAIHVFHAASADSTRNYMINGLAAHWRDWGFTVTSGPAKSVTTELGIMHVDRTRIEADELPRTTAGQMLLNRRVLDISKRTFSTLRVGPEDDWDGPVIVKSNLNSFGNPESELRRPNVVTLLRRQVARYSWRAMQTLPPNDYPVLPCISAVPAWVWEHPDLLVERFIAERQGDLYAVRGWIFFGERSYAYRLFSTSPMIKTGNISHYDILTGIPPELEEFRRKHHLDFGKLDYVLLDGKPVVIDMNKTPTTIAKPDSPRMNAMAEGIYDFLGKSR